VLDARAVADAFREHFEPLDREQFVVLVLDGKNRVLGFNVVSLGSLTATLVHPREVFKPAILSGTARTRPSPSGAAGRESGRNPTRSARCRPS
jgi:DNA repair protein RadC